VCVRMCVCVCVCVCACVQGRPELCMNTVYDRMNGCLPAKNTVYTFWPTLCVCVCVCVSEQVQVRNECDCESRVWQVGKCPL